MDFSNIKKHIADRINKLVSIDVYSVFALPEASYPFVVYNLPPVGLNDDGVFFNRVLDIDVYSVDSEDDALENATLISNGLNGYVFNTVDGSFRTDISIDGQIPSDPNVKPLLFRMNQRYTIKVLRNV